MQEHQYDREPDVVKVGRQECQHDKGYDLNQHARCRKEARAKAVGKIATERPHHNETGHQWQHVDACPERRHLKAIAMQRQPDALQPDDEHELQATTRCTCKKATDVTGGEHTDFEQIEPEHWIADVQLDPDEYGE